jgi:hypothetical protein
MDKQERGRRLGWYVLAAAIVSLSITAVCVMRRTDQTPSNQTGKAIQTQDSPASSRRDFDRPKRAPSLRDTDSESSRDSRSPNYDALKLAFEVEGAGATVWKLEKRDEDWATQREDSIRSALTDELKRVEGSPQIASIECRASSCRVTVDLDGEFGDDMLADARANPVMMLAPFSTVREFESVRERLLIAYYLVYPPSLRPEGAFSDFVSQSRNRAAELLAAQREETDR